MEIQKHKIHNIKLISTTDDLYQEIECINCHKKVTVGECFNSHFHFNSNGIWACNVCPECHQKEVEYIAKQQSTGQ